MKRFIPFVLLIAPIVQQASAATYICDIKHAYHFNGTGQLVPHTALEKHTINLWPTLTFDDETGRLRYGREATTTTPSRWEEEHVTVTQRGSSVNSATGHYLQGGRVQSAIIITAFQSPLQLFWLNGGLSIALTGTCRMFD